MDDASKPQANFIAGEWVQSTTLLGNIDPSTGEVFAEVSLASIVDVDLAVLSPLRHWLMGGGISLPPPKRRPDPTFRREAARSHVFLRHCHLPFREIWE